MKESYYFSHDYNSRNDRKIVSLFKVHGLQGIGAFWNIVEMLYEEDGYLNLTECERIAFELRTDCDFIKHIIFDFELFKNDGERFWSESVIKRLDKRNDKSIKARESANSRWKNANAMRTQCDGNAIKERKGKEIRENTVLTAPEISEVERVFIQQGGTKEMALSFFNKYESIGWYKSGSPIKSFSPLVGSFITNWNKNLQPKNGFQNNTFMPQSAPLKTIN